MSKEQLLAEILRLPVDDRRGLIEQAVDSLPDTLTSDPDISPEFRAELNRRHAEMLAHPDDEISWEQVSQEMRRRERR